MPDVLASTNRSCRKGIFNLQVQRYYRLDLGRKHRSNAGYNAAGVPACHCTYHQLQRQQRGTRQPSHDLCQGRGHHQQRSTELFISNLSPGEVKAMCRFCLENSSIAVSQKSGTPSAPRPTTPGYRACSVYLMGVSDFLYHSTISSNLSAGTMIPRWLMGHVGKIFQSGDRVVQLRL
jgi:hypothetical protein